MALIPSITNHSQLLSFSALTLGGAVTDANTAITNAENAAGENQSVDISDKNTVWDGTNWNIVITLKTVTFPSNDI